MASSSADTAATTHGPAEDGQGLRGGAGEGGRGAPIATIVISTRNRKDELRRTLASCATLDAGGGWIETIVVDDNSTDGTREMIAAEFPAVRLIHKTANPGYIVSRNLGARESRAPVIFSIDDDAVFTSPDTVLKTLAEFDHPRIGAVAIPHIHVTDGPREYDRSPDPTGIFIGGTYVGTAHAVRRDVFLALGGYQEALIHQAEESEFCLRMLAAGYVVRLGNAPPIHHFPSTKRNLPRQLHYGARNGILLTWIHAPALLLLPRLLSNIAGGCVNAIKLGHPRSYLGGVVAGIGCIFKFWSLRRPVSTAGYRMFRRLIAAPGQPFDAVAAALPELQCDSPYGASGTGEPAVAAASGTLKLRA